MMLVEEGRLQLTDPVSKWLPAFKTMQVSAPKVNPASGEFSFETVMAEREITIYDLLRHTSGFTYGMWSENVPVREAYVKAGLGSTPGTDLRTLAVAEAIERLSKVPLAQQPGTTWEYGLSTDVLGFVIEAVEGARLGDVLRRRLFGPLGMADSGFWVQPERIGRLAQPLAAEPGTSKKVEYIDVASPPKLDAGGHGGVSTAYDYFRFCQMLLQKGTFDGARILSRSSVALMGSDQLGDSIRAPLAMAMGSPGYTWGLGFAVRRADRPAAVLGSPDELYWGGAPSGGLFWIDPREQIVGVFLTSATWSDYGVYRKAVKQIVHAAVSD
jgi:CubicO group peptidase (beta-lactamase class C family)